MSKSRCFCFYVLVFIPFNVLSYISFDTILCFVTSFFLYH